MTPYKQLIAHNPAAGQFGDCHRTVIACLCDVPPEEVPHPYADGLDDGAEAWRRIDAWLKPRGLCAVGVPFDADPEDVMRMMKGLNPDVHYILGGASPVADHFVIACNDKIVHDPAGHGRFNRGLDGYTWVHLLVPLSMKAEI